MLRNATLAMMAALGLAVVSQAAPIVTKTESLLTVPGFNTLDFFYTASAGAEFTNYRLSVEDGLGAPTIQDPVKATTSDQDADAPDTFMNTVYSLYGFGPASYNFNTYKPTGPGSGTPPVAKIDWSVFDTGTGDTNSFDAGAPYGVVNAPFHLARVLTAVGSSGTWSFQAFDNLTTNGASFTGSFGQAIVPEPATLSLLGLALVAGLGLRRRTA